MTATSPTTLHGLRAAIERGETDPRRALDGLLQRIERLNGKVNAYIGVEPDRLREQLAKRLASAGSSRGPLFGLPVTIKANICVQGEETTCASKILTGFRPPYDATVIERLTAAGAVVVPRANMDEFAFGSSTENSAAGPARNPWDTERVPGGSSGGSAAAVAADLAVAALGSDTGGSIRQPAAFCGVVGLKPTYGRVSRYGLVAFASSLDQIGPITKDAEDCALLLSVIAGHDARDSTSAPVDVPDYLAEMRRPVSGLRIGLPQLSEEGLDPEVRKATQQAVEVFKKLGCATVPVELPNIASSVATYYIVATAEASSNLARYDGVKYGLRAGAGGGGWGVGTTGLIEMYQRTRAEGFGAEAKRRIILGTYVLSRGYYDAYYLKGMRVRTLIKRDFDEAFKRCDAIAMPTAPTPAFRIGEKTDDPLQMYLSDIYTICANLAGIPALSMPCGFSSGGLPIGLQLCGAPFGEGRLLQLAHAYEHATDWRAKQPALAKAA